jgi:hypothetical protein
VFEEAIDFISGNGFARLPHPRTGDIFFVMEGARFFEDDSLENLIGFITVDENVEVFFGGDRAPDADHDPAPSRKVCWRST